MGEPLPPSASGIFPPGQWDRSGAYLDPNDYSRRSSSAASIACTLSTAPCLTETPLTPWPNVLARTMARAPSPSAVRSATHASTPVATRLSLQVAMLLVTTVSTLVKSLTAAPSQVAKLVSRVRTTACSTTALTFCTPRVVHPSQHRLAMPQHSWSSTTLTSTPPMPKRKPS